MTRVEEIRQLIDEHAAAIRARDADAVVALVDEDVLLFDLIEPLWRRGRAAARERAVEWFGSFSNGPQWDNRDVSISAGDDVAFCTMLSHVTGTLNGTGAQVDMWFRKTLGLRRHDGRWLIVHDHGSVPFSPKTQIASLNLVPENGSVSRPAQ